MLAQRNALGNSSLYFPQSPERATRSFNYFFHLHFSLLRLPFGPPRWGFRVLFAYYPARCAGLTSYCAFGALGYKSTFSKPLQD
jgi:hypothetical protein